MLLDSEGLIFDWDSKKAEINIRKHGVSFEEAVTAFGDPVSLTIQDSLHSDRFVLLGMSFNARLLVVVHAEPGDLIRIISARKANSEEGRQYYEGE